MSNGVLLSVLHDMLGREVWDMQNKIFLGLQNNV